jgi:tungstate transport system permease protein
MTHIGHGFTEALRIMLTLDREFLSAVSVSLIVASTSTFIATITGVPFGVWIAHKEFRGKRAVITILHTLMSLPTVVVGLMVYSLISRSGPLGSMGLLYTRAAMVIGQVILAFPIIAGLTIVAATSLDKRVATTVASLGATPAQGFAMFLHEARFGIMAAVVAGFGRVFAEIGVSMMLGGNIRAYTRNITTTIALETSRGELALGLALGIVLLTVALIVNIAFALFREKAK